jgi:hypothetical protein
MVQQSFTAATDVTRCPSDSNYLLPPRCHTYDEVTIRQAKYSFVSSPTIVQQYKILLL